MKLFNASSLYFAGLLVNKATNQTWWQATADPRPPTAERCSSCRVAWKCDLLTTGCCKADSDKAAWLLRFLHCRCCCVLVSLSVVQNATLHFSRAPHFMLLCQVIFSPFFFVKKNSFFAFSFFFTCSFMLYIYFLKPI